MWLRTRWQTLDEEEEEKRITEVPNGMKKKVPNTLKGVRFILEEEENSHENLTNEEAAKEMQHQSQNSHEEAAAVRQSQTQNSHEELIKEAAEEKKQLQERNVVIAHAINKADRHRSPTRRAKRVGPGWCQCCGSGFPRLCRRRCTNVICICFLKPDQQEQAEQIFPITDDVVAVIRNITLKRYVFVRTGSVTVQAPDSFSCISSHTWQLCGNADYDSEDCEPCEREVAEEEDEGAHVQEEVEVDEVMRTKEEEGEQEDDGVAAGTGECCARCGSLALFPGDWLCEPCERVEAELE